jgi:hypothetical protein
VPHPHILFPNVMSLPISTIDSNILCSVVEHVFMPPKLPQKAPAKEVEQETNAALCLFLLDAAHAFRQSLPHSQRSTWNHMVKMIELVWRDVKALSARADLQSALSDLSVGGKSYDLHVIPAF